MKMSFQAYNTDVQIEDNTHTLEATIWPNALHKFFSINVHDLPNLASIGVELDSMFRQKLDDQEGTFQIRITNYKGKMSVSVSKFARSTQLLENNNHDEEDLEDDHSPKLLAIAEFADVSKSLEKVNTPAKKETTFLKKRKTLTDSNDANDVDSSSNTGEDEE
ncbi:hypothetical protein ACHQM5_014049 [Ranunculus cassubicifolius]